MVANLKTEPIDDIDPKHLPDLTEKQMSFVVAICEGKTATDAYRSAGYKTEGWTNNALWSEASKLRASPKVSQWISALRRQQFTRGLYTRDDHLAELSVAVEECRLDGNRGAMVNAIKAKGQVMGYYVSLHEDVSKRDRSPAEMIDEIRAKLGDEAADVLARGLGVEPLKRTG